MRRCFNALKLEDPILAIGRFCLSLSLHTTPLHTLAARYPWDRALPLCDERIVSPSKTWQGNQFGQGASLSRAGQFSLRRYLIGKINCEGQPTSYFCPILHFPFQIYWTGTIPRPHIRRILRKWAILLPPFFPLTMQTGQTYKLS